MIIDPEVKKKVDYFLKIERSHLGDALGIEFLEFSRTKVVACMPVDERTHQPFGLLHGGASVALAETVASVGAWLNVNPETHAAVGLEINANHIRPVRSGQVIGTATPVHRGAQTQIWTIDIRNEQGKRVSISRCTLAVIKKPGGSV